MSIIRLLGLFEDDLNSSDHRSYSTHFVALFKSAVILSHKYNIRVDGELIGWEIEQTNGKVIDSLRKTCFAISSSNVFGIVGPRLSEEAHAIAGFGERIGIPVVSYTATDPDLSSRIAYPAFYRTIPSDTSAALSLLKLFMRFNWTSCVIIYQNDAYGYSGMRTINEIFMKNNFIVKEMIKFDISTRTIQGNLKDYLLNSETRIVVLWALPIFTPTILQYALDDDLVGPYFLWILSSSPSLDNLNEDLSDKLLGMLTVEAVTGSIFDGSINASLLSAAYKIWEENESDSFPGENNVNPYALFAFDAAWLLIQSLQQLCTMNTENKSIPCLSFVNSSSCFDRHLINGGSFFDRISSTKFVGVTGPIKYRINETDRSTGIFYLTQNFQRSEKGFSFIPVLKYSEGNSWQNYLESNTIVWPDKSNIVPSDHAVLSGVILRIGIIKSPPFAMVEDIKDEFGHNITKIIGYVSDLIEFLREKINFIPNITFVPSNNSYTKSIYAVANGDYDILMGDVTVTAQRREIVSFSSSIFDNSLSVIIRKPISVDVDLFSYLRPFSEKLWIGILAATVYASILMCLLERRANAALRDRSLLSASAMSIWYSIGTIMGYGVDFKATTASGRLVTVALYMLSLIMVATYTASLASNLTKGGSKYIINGIDDIKKGKLPSYRIGIIEGTAMEQYYLREISQGTRDFYPAKGRQQILDSLLDGTIDATFLDSGVAEYITNNLFCNLTIVGGTFNDGIFGIVMKKKWSHEQNFDMNILFLRESGQLNHLRKKWFQTGKCQHSDETLNAIKIESMAGLFLIFGIITILSLLPFIWNKRLIIKNYFWTLKSRNYIGSKKNDSSMTNSNQSYS